MLPALWIMDPDIGPVHMTAPGPGIRGGSHAVVRAERAFAHTIKSLWHWHDILLGRPFAAGD